MILQKSGMSDSQQSNYKHTDFSAVPSMLGYLCKSDMRLYSSFEKCKNFLLKIFAWKRFCTFVAHFVKEIIIQILIIEIRHQGSHGSSRTRRIGNTFLRTFETIETYWSKRSILSKHHSKPFKGIRGGGRRPSPPLQHPVCRYTSHFFLLKD